MRLIVILTVVSMCGSGLATALTHEGTAAQLHPPIISGERLKQFQALEKALSDIRRQYEALGKDEKKALNAREDFSAGLDQVQNELEKAVNEATTAEWEGDVQDLSGDLNTAASTVRAYTTYPHVPIRDFDLRIKRLIRRFGGDPGQLKPPEAENYLKALKRLPQILDSVAHNADWKCRRYVGRRDTSRRGQASVFRYG